MINTFFSAGLLNSPAALLASILIGIAFGMALEQAGFGSSRRLAGIFYFRDMTVLKVMFTAVITAMLGLSCAKAAGWVTTENIYFLPTRYTAQILGGLLFGAGFVMGGWCPGTGAVGVASGRIDALVFLIGIAGGSILYNELYPLLAPLAGTGSGVRFAYDTLGISEGAFAIGFTTIAILCFWGAELLDKKQGNPNHLFCSLFLICFSLILLAGAIGLFMMTRQPATPASGTSEQVLLQNLQTGADHIDPQDLADRLLAGEFLSLVDIRTPAEFSRFHIRSAINIQPADLPRKLAAQKNRGKIVLYSNGMTHPAQARDSLARLGFNNVYLLTDGLEGFLNTCLKPVSLRAEPAQKLLAIKINAWRAFFLAQEPLKPIPPAHSSNRLGITPPGLVETVWLAAALGSRNLKIIDLRSQTEYNGGHIPGSLSLNKESLRGCVYGRPSSLLPAPMLADHFSQMGIAQDDLLVLVCSDKLQDATLAGMACERLEHRSYVVLQGGFSAWVKESRPLSTSLPEVIPTLYVAPARADRFTADAGMVLAALGQPEPTLLDVRSADYFSGQKQDEARGGHIPGAINRDYLEDVIQLDAGPRFKPAAELAAAYAQLIPSKTTPIIVHCRTGHQASQTWFVLTHVLHYKNVQWYDAGWTEWAARSELPIETKTNDESLNKNHTDLFVISGQDTRRSNSGDNK